MIKFFDRNIELIIKLLIFFSAIMVITPVFFINGSLYFWFVVIVVIIFNLAVVIKDFKTYLGKFKFEMLFIICCFFSSLINYPKYNNIYSIVYIIYTAYLIFGMLPVRIKDDKIIKRDNKIIEYVIIGYTFIITVISLADLIIFKNNEMFNIIIVDRFSGIYLNANQAAFWGFSSIVFSYKNIKDNKYFHFINIIIHFILIALSGCRSVYLALFVFGFLNFIDIYKYKIKNWKTYIISFVILILVSIIGVSLIRYKWFFKQHFSIESVEQIINILSGLRYLLWKDSLEIFINSPIIGVGVNNIRYAAKVFLDSTSFINLGAWEDPHNIIIGLLTYTGIIGFSSFSILIYKYFKLGFKQVNKYPIILMISILTISIFDISVIFDNRIISILFWYFLSCILSEGGNNGQTNKI